jgi:hypothetical protein
VQAAVHPPPYPLPRSTPSLESRKLSKSLIAACAATLSQNGNILTVTVVGTYTVNPDCTGTLTLQVAPIGITVPVSIVIDNSWNEFQAIDASPGCVRTRIGHKLYPGINI